MGVERYLETVRHDPVRLRAFMLDLPKGGDLHSHLSGAASTELLISLAAQDGLCIHTTTFVAAAGPCGAGQRPAADTSSDPAFRRAVLMAWSMEGFQAGQGESGHDHFFATFGKFGAVTDYRLRYRDLKTLARTGLDHAFLDGASLWRSPDTFVPATPCARDRLAAPHPGPGCRTFLAGSPKASLQWQQEARFAAFEHRYR
ncbi:hypothetical protein ACFVYA_48750 [Amycolatopsis sp. NPDC058278]|uniref:hypothetical protein n=1 Tax=Amycolatopsis sp. NPDC058278 TaxID=3346417 RepID=UPI0036D75E88